MTVKVKGQRQWMNIMKECFQNTTGKLHIRTHNGCDNKNKTYKVELDKMANGILPLVEELLVCGERKSYFFLNGMASCRLNILQ